MRSDFSLNSHRYICKYYYPVVLSGTDTFHVDLGRIYTEFRVLPLSADFETPMVSP